MPRRTSILYTLTAIFCGVLGLLWAQGINYGAPDWMFSYAPGMWWPKTQYPPPWEPDSLSNTKPCNETQVLGTLPRLGYPMRPAAFTGLNDTIQVVVMLWNRSKTDYSLSGKSPEKWFKPRIFENKVNVYNWIPWRDSTQIGWRFRCWTKDGRFHAPYDSILGAYEQPAATMIFDAWNLVPGFFTIVAAPTNSIPSSFFGRLNGDFYEYRAAQTMADTVNAYEGNFWRMVMDSNFSDAHMWIDKMLAVNPKSIPGWWLQSRLRTMQSDTAKSIAALDSAIKFLANHSDQAMPDTANGALFPAEKAYLYWVTNALPYEKDRLTP